MKESPELFENITHHAIVHKEQGYAFYFQHNNIEIHQTNGRVCSEQSEKITYDTHFRLASVSKQFIAMGIITLVENGKLDYDTKIKDIFDELPDYFHQITVRMLLNHTSGIYDYEDMPHSETDPQVLDQDILPFLKMTTTTYFTPGEEYRYSNTGYILLGLMIENISNQNIDAYLNEYVFKPAGLLDTYVNYQGKTIIPKRAYGHILENGKLIVKDQYWCSATIGDGGLYSTIHELNKWITYLENNEEQLLPSMFHPHVLPNGKHSEYGFGMRIVSVQGKNIYYHCGDTIGTNTILLFSPAFHLRCIFLTNFGGVDTTVVKENVIEYLKNR